MTQVFRGFWHGPSLSAYELLCMRSVVRLGHTFELYTYDPAIEVPDWIERRNANDILPTDHVMVYRTGSGAGSPSLHSNIFRYELMHQLGGWWLDLDVLMLRSDASVDGDFYAVDARDHLLTAVMRFAKGHRLLQEAIERCRSVKECESVWGQTGPDLIHELITKHGLRDRAQPAITVVPIDFCDIDVVFDPGRSEEVFAVCAESSFVHLFNEMRRASGFPREAGPPKGSFLDRLFELYDLKVSFPYRLEYPSLKRWLGNHIDFNTHKTLHETYKRQFEDARRNLIAINDRRTKLERELESLLKSLRKKHQKQ